MEVRVHREERTDITGPESSYYLVAKEPFLHTLITRLGAAIRNRDFRWLMPNRLIYPQLSAVRVRGNDLDTASRIGSTHRIKPGRSFFDR